MSDELTKEELLAEFDNLFRKAHNGYHLNDEEFECNIKACPEIYQQIRQLIQQRPKIDDKYVEEKVKELWSASRNDMTFPAEQSIIRAIVSQIICDAQGLQMPEINEMFTEETTRKWLDENRHHFEGKAFNIALLTKIVKDFVYQTIGEVKGVKEEKDE